MNFCAVAMERMFTTPGLRLRRYLPRLSVIGGRRVFDITTDLSGSEADTDSEREDTPDKEIEVIDLTMDDDDGVIDLTMDEEDEDQDAGEPAVIDLTSI